MKNFDVKISKQNIKIEKVESIISIHKNTTDQLLVKCDGNGQYSRRSCLHIHGVEVKVKESKGDVMNTLEKCYSSLNFPFDPNYIDRAQPDWYTGDHSGGKVKYIIVKFRSWKARQFFYKSSPWYHNDGSKKPGYSV